MDIIVGVGDMKISDDPTATIVTHSLGSCIGLAVYDPSVKVGGVLHYMLPDSTKSSKSKVGLSCLLTRAYRSYLSPVTS